MAKKKKKAKKPKGKKPFSTNPKGVPYKPSDMSNRKKK